MQFRKFQDNKIFTKKNKNTYADYVMTSIGQHYGVKNINDILFVGGSVAKNLQGITNHEPNDLDLITRDRHFFKFCQTHLKNIFSTFKVINVSDNRVLINNGWFDIEIWIDIHHYQIKKYKNLKMKLYVNH